MFDESMSSTMSQENKQRLINMLCVKFQKEVFVVKGNNSENIFFSKPKICKAEDPLYCAATLNIAPHVRGNILFLHALSDYDNTFALFRKRKKKFMNILNSTELKQVVNIFRDESACPDDIDEVGHKVLIALYRGRTVKN
ncbi:hypothetical protein AVEN_121618-1 [Araneus ventricosus]|uniref:Uncharacterized protein n=1 Tax=Araneus ventricosus TaxID=182803 RepID=A0A4Y2N3U8_ARAVE|nr:hypothetical protein AVEN_121618-1 [Araneus ventricosus]